MKDHMDILDHDVDVDEVLAGSGEWGFNESSSVGTHSRRTRRLTTTDATTTTDYAATTYYTTAAHHITQGGTTTHRPRAHSTAE